MITRNEEIMVAKFNKESVFEINGEKDIYKKALFFDLEHYVYKIPICIGVFGCCIYDEDKNVLKVTQYMIENKIDSEDILKLSYDYFNAMKEKGYEYIVTFSGNNDFIMIKYLFEKYGIPLDIFNNFKHIDIQKEYEKITKANVGLKALEKVFLIDRESALISGSNLAKTIKKIVTDEEYMDRMPEEKKSKILLYNEQDVTSLFRMIVDWKNILHI